MNRGRLVLLVLFIFLISGAYRNPDIHEKKDGVVEVKAKISPSDSSWQTYEANTLYSVEGIDRASEIKKDPLGGRLDQQSKATGYFRVEKVNGRWWFIDPQGYLYYNIGLVEVGPGKSIKQKEALNNKYGTEQQWVNATVKLIKENGFNGAGAWSAEELLKNSNEPIAYTRYFNFIKPFLNEYKKKYHIDQFTNAGWQGYPNDLIFVFSPDFEVFVNTRAQELQKFAAEKNMLGIFSDNEMPIVPDALDRHLKLLDHGDPGYLAAWSWLRGRKGPEVTLQDLTNEDRDDFLEFYMDRYFSVVSSAIRKNLPNHLYLGCRFNQEEEELKSPGVFRSAGKYCDVISINHYRKWEPDADLMQKWGEWSGRPFLITEWYVKAEDSGMENETGAGWIVKTQKDRGYFYQNFTLKLMQSPYCVGWQWFKYLDNDPSDAGADKSNRNSNKGILDMYYNPYKDLLKEMKALNLKVYSIIDIMDKKEKQL